MSKKLSVLSIIILGFSIQGCAPKWLLVNSSGLATYNRHTGQIELLWENKSAIVHEVHDTVYVDSCNVRANP